MLVGYAFHVIIQGVCFYWLLENLKSCSFGEAIEGFAPSFRFYLDMAVMCLSSPASSPSSFPIPESGCGSTSSFRSILRIWESSSSSTGRWRRIPLPKLRLHSPFSCRRWRRWRATARRRGRTAITRNSNNGANHRFLFLSTAILVSCCGILLHDL